MVAPESKDDAAATPLEVVLGYLEALNAGDADAVAGAVAEDFVNEHVSLRGDSLTGRDAYRERLDGFLSSMPGLRYEVERVLASNDEVAVAYAMSAAFLPPGEEAGRPFQIRGVLWFAVSNGRITRRVDYRDGVDFEQQVGLR